MSTDQTADQLRAELAHLERVLRLAERALSEDEKQITAALASHGRALDAVAQHERAYVAAASAAMFAGELSSLDRFQHPREAKVVDAHRELERRAFEAGVTLHNLTAGRVRRENAIREIKGQVDALEQALTRDLPRARALAESALLGKLGLAERG